MAKTHVTDLYKDIEDLFQDSQLEIIACELCGDYHPPDIHLTPITPDDHDEPAAASSAPDATLSEILADRPFAILGYSADGAVWCPSCLRSAAGLSPSHADSDGQPVAPLYARDNTVREERCENCDHLLVELLHTKFQAYPPRTTTAELRAHSRGWSLDFDRMPSLAIRTALKLIGWRWNSSSRTWQSTQATPRVPAGVVLPSAAKSHVMARGPVVRHRDDIRATEM